MAKARKPAAPPALPEDETTDELLIRGPAEADEPDEDDALSELRGLGVDGEYKFTVSRVARKPGEQSGYCATYQAGDLSLDAIRDQFGGGKYKVRVTDSGGRYVANRTLEIMDVPKRDAPAAAPAQPFVMPQGPDMQGIAALLSAVKPGADASTTIMPLILAMMESQGKMFAAMMNRPQPEAMKPMELIALLKATQNDKASDPVELLMRGLELGKSLGGGGEDTSFMGVAKTGLEALMPLIQQQATQPAAVPAPVRRALPAPVPVPAQLPNSSPAMVPIPNAVQEAAPAQETGDVNILRKLQWLRGQTAALIVQASRNKDPALYAEVFLDNLPPGIEPTEIFERFNAPDAVAQLAQVDARVNQFAPWFEQFRQEVLGLLTDDEEGEEDPGAPGDLGVDGDPNLT